MRWLWLGLAGALLTLLAAGCGWLVEDGDGSASASGEDVGSEVDAAEVEGVEPWHLEAGEAYVFEGEVAFNQIDPCVLEDHPDPCDVGAGYGLKLETEYGRLDVVYDYGNRPEGFPCTNGEAVKGGTEARVGDRVEVYGGAFPEEYDFHGPGIGTCHDDDFYIEQVE